ncbi:hypothetical protein IJT10_00010 [bacterium]|nr:hypothetical protein [bacterium]
MLDTFNNTGLKDSDADFVDIPEPTNVVFLLVVAVILAIIGLGLLLPYQNNL